MTLKNQLIRDCVDRKYFSYGINDPVQIPRRFSPFSDRFHSLRLWLNHFKSTDININ